MTLWIATAVALAASVTLSPGDDVGALTASLQPGDVVTFNAGTYEVDGTVNWTGVGTADAPVQLRAASGEVVLLNIGDYGGYVAQIEDSSYLTIRGLTFAGPEFTTTSTYGYGGNNVSGFRVADSDHVTIEDCTVRNVGGTALRVDGNTNNMVIRHNEMTGTADGSGLYVGCGDGSCWMQDSLVELNLIHDVQGYGIYLNPGTQAVTLQNNVIFRTDRTGIVLTTTDYGPHNIVNANAIWESAEDGIYVEGSALIQNNLIFQVDGDGIYSRNNNDGNLSDLQISHNTVAMADGWAARLDDWFDLENMVFANNALANPIGYGFYWDDPTSDPYGYGSDTGFGETPNYISHNVITGLVDGFDPVQRPSFLLPGGGITDFENFDNLDFYPTVSSTLRDQADANGQAYIPRRDFNGTARDGAAPDVGAYEFDSVGNPGWVVQEDFKVYTETEGRNVTAANSGCCGGGKPDATAAFAPAPFLLLLLFLRRRQ